MDSFIANQSEILNQAGHQEWHRVTVLDFGGNNLEISVMPYETWSEPSEDDVSRAKSVRGKGDRARSAEVAARRARRRVRHLCKALQARYMLTLTTKEVITDFDRLQKLFQEFVRRVRGAGEFQYVATHEFQERGALHLHIAVAKRQDYKLLWSIWHRVVGQGNGRVHVTSGNKKASVNRIASYISKYISKSFETGELNRKRYWASRNIGEPKKEVHLLRKDWDFGQVLMYIVELCDERQAAFNTAACWCDGLKGLFWMAAGGETPNG